MSEIDRALQLFQNAGLAFPAIPEVLAEKLTQRDEWLFSTRELDAVSSDPQHRMSPYNLQHYVGEYGRALMDDFAILSHSGHGCNSYAIQYYLGFGPLRLFLHLGWGGVYSDADRDASRIRECFLLADQIVAAVHPSIVKRESDFLTIVSADFYGSYWIRPGSSRHLTSEAEPKRTTLFDEEEVNRIRHPSNVLTKAIRWQKSRAEIVKDRLSRLLSYAREEGRICPELSGVEKLWKMLFHRRSDGRECTPPLPPLILQGWEFSDDLQKQERFVSHLQYAADHGLLEPVERFVRKLRPDEWYYGETR